MTNTHTYAHMLYVEMSGLLIFMTFYVDFMFRIFETLSLNVSNEMRVCGDVIIIGLNM